MDAPGFPPPPRSAVPETVVWLLLLALLVVAAAMTVVVLRRGRSVPLAWRLAMVASVLAVSVPAVLLYTPAFAHAGTDTVDGRGECPLSTVQGSFMDGDSTSGMYRFWQPCVTASRIRLGLSLGGYGLVAGAIGLAALRAGGRRPAASPRGRVTTAAGA